MAYQTDPLTGQVHTTPTGKETKDSGVQVTIHNPNGTTTSGTMSNGRAVPNKR